MSSQSCMVFTIIHTAFCLLLFWKYRFWWEVISLISLICTLVRFMNVENCLIVFFFFPCWKQFDHMFCCCCGILPVEIKSTYMIWPLKRIEISTSLALIWGFFTIGTPTTRKKRGPDNRAAGGVVCTVVTLRYFGLRFRLDERAAHRHELELASPSPLLRLRPAAGWEQTEKSSSGTFSARFRRIMLCEEWTTHTRGLRGE